jgi:hypothetical protein
MNKIRLTPLDDEVLKMRALKLLDNPPKGKPNNDNSTIGAYLAQTCNENSIHTKNQQSSPHSRSSSPIHKYGNDDVIWILRQDETGIIREVIKRTP